MTLNRLGIFFISIITATIVVVPNHVACLAFKTSTRITSTATTKITSNTSTSSDNSKTPIAFRQQKHHQILRTRAIRNISTENAATENDTETIYLSDNIELKQITTTPTTGTSNSRRTFLDSSISSVLAMTIAITGTTATTATDTAVADVSDGTSLPDGAQQFARIVRLKSDLTAVQKRLKNADASVEIDTKEWDNIGKFLRTIYSVADSDMKFIAKGIVDTDRKNSALQSIDQMKKYAQAGDVSISKKDSTNLSVIMEKCNQLTQTFLDALSDVPDEL